ncbi:MAG TPA: polysaccharide deacetylase family protein [Candidatus Polarisedimenticolia bacterium]|nr:polysaccharide deacetylase family protein [Candidatus Polarisedimenticolia bacterium]
MLRDLVKSGMAHALHASGGGRLYGSLRGARRSPVILGYHRVVDSFDAAATTAIPALLISTGTLERQLAWLQRDRKVVPLDEIGERVFAGQPVDHLAAVTFDDGYRDVYEQAFPILKRMGIPAAVFVVAGTVGTAQMLNHDRLYGLLRIGYQRWTSPSRELALLLDGCGVAPLHADALAAARGSAYTATRLLLAFYPRADLLALIGALEARFGVEGENGGLPMSWDMLREMRAAGITIGSHTMSHALLDLEGRRTVRDELADSRRTLEAHLGARIDHFAYPDGRFDAATIEEVAREYRYAYTICGHRDPRFPRHTLSRRVLWERSCSSGSESMVASILACQVNGLFDPMSPCRRPHGASITGRSIPPGQQRRDWKGALA